MGDFVIKIEATGGHGCQRDKGTGDTVGHCGSVFCPDCHARDLVAKLKEQGVMIKSAVLTHWPGTEGQVTDDLLTGIRQGDFPEKGQQQASSTEGEKDKEKWEGAPPPPSGGPPPQNP